MPTFEIKYMDGVTEIIQRELYMDALKYACESARMYGTEIGGFIYWPDTQET